MSFEEPNYILEQENYGKQYQENIEALKNRPEVIELDKLFFEVFEKYEPGKRLLEIAKERWLIPSLAAKGTRTYKEDLLWGEGFKEFIRLILSSIKTHQQRILAGK
jgi:hypothetical protein